MQLFFFSKVLLAFGVFTTLESGMQEGGEEALTSGGLENS